MKKSLWVAAIAPAFSLALVIQGCAPPRSEAPSSIPAAHRSFEGSIADQLDRLEKAPWRDSLCDDSFKERKYEIARALDAHYEEIQKFAENLPPSRKYKQVDMPPTKVRENIAPPHPDPGWRLDESSWSNLDQYYQKIKNSPIDVKWVNLDLNVRSILTDDENRMSYAYTYDDKDSEPRLNELLSFVDSCLKDEYCAAPTFMSAQLDFLGKNPAFSYHLQKILNDSLPASERRASLGQLREWIDYELSRFKFRVNPKVSMDSVKHQIQLPLDPGPFTGSTIQLAHYIESVWSSEKLSLHVFWSSPSPDLFSMVLDSSANGRSYVSHKARQVHLFPNVHARSIAHEIGHVLGFDDHYYTVWNETNCTYETQSRDEDLMSGSDGSVLPEEWDALMKQYPSEVIAPGMP